MAKDIEGEGGGLYKGETDGPEELFQADWG